MDVEHVFRHDGNAFRAQIFTHEIRIAFAHVHVGETVDHLRTAEYLGLHEFTACAQLHHLVDQQFHRVGTVAPRQIRHVAHRQHEVVHAAHARAAVPQTGRDARAEHRDQHDVLVGHEILAGQHLDRVVLEVVVEEKERRLPRRHGTCLELFERHVQRTARAQQREWSRFGAHRNIGWKWSS